jgi:hypothetical protein
MLGTHLLPAQAARVPLVFSLIDGSPSDVTLQQRSQVAAIPPPSAPSLEQIDSGTPKQGEPIVFTTVQAITLCRSKLITLYSIVPGSDRFADHSGRLTEGFTLFDDLQLTEHAVYLGHDQLFALAGEITVILSFTLKSGAGLAVETQWEYLTDSGWLPFTSLREDDTTNGLRQDGQIVLNRACGPDAKKATIEGHTSFWLRGRLATPLLPQEATGQPPLPVINDIRASVRFGKEGLLPEAAFNNAVSLDTTKDFYPFGPRPATYDVFYIASKEVFQRKRARVSMALVFSKVGQVAAGTQLSLEWEYNDGARWNTLGVEASAETKNFAGSTTDLHRTAAFLCPGDWGEASVNGVKNYWLRVRILSGDYGHPVGVIFAAEKITPTADTLNPPVISRLTLGYTYITDPETPDHCLAHNDFAFEDQTEACRWPDQTFTPFQLVADREPAVHFGFDRPLPSGFIGLYVEIPEALGDTSARRASPFIWEYRSARGWTELGVLDETLGFQRSGMLQFVGPPDAIAAPGLGESLFRIRARLKNGERDAPLPIGGIWLNAVWATHSQSYEREPLGTSDGNPGQTFSARRAPVLTGEMLEVQEWTGRGEYWRTFVQNVPETDLRFERDSATDEVTAVWVRWSARPHLYDSGATDRHYTIERALGLVRVGDNRRGWIPPAGRRIVLSYESGGGLAGNVPAGAISEVRTAVPFISGATNPVPATGGAAIEALSAVRARGPQRLRHRDRAVSALDFEWMAHEASPGIARARCLPITGPAGRAQRGWVTLVVVPQSAVPQPQPSVGTRRRVREYITERVPATAAQHLRVHGPSYALVSVQAEIVPLQADQAAVVEARVRGNLNRFLHPLTGGVDRQGWTFGETVHLSQISRVIKGTEGVDHASNVGLSVAGRIFAESIPVGADTLIAPGDHELKLVVGVA